MRIGAQKYVLNTAAIATWICCISRIRLGPTYLSHSCVVNFSEILAT